MSFHSQPLKAAFWLHLVAGVTSEDFEIDYLCIRDHRCTGLPCSFVVDLLLAAVFAALT